MNEFDANEKERLDNWRALQISLGLMPDEPAVPAPDEGPAPDDEPTSQLPESDAHAARIEEEPSFGRVGISFAPAVEPSERQTEAVKSEPEAEQDVEVGEAPEELPEDPAEESPREEKRRRRRRRRRRRSESAAAADDVNGEPHDLESAVDDRAAVEVESEDEEDDSDDDGEDADDDIEPISLPDWNVPSWQELIDSLYRPER